MIKWPVLILMLVAEAAVFGFLGVSGLRYTPSGRIVSEEFPVWSSQEGATVQGLPMIFVFRPSGTLVKVTRLWIKIALSSPQGAQTASLNLRIELNGLTASNVTISVVDNARISLGTFEVTDAVARNSLRVGANTIGVETRMLLHHLSLIVEFSVRS